MRLKTFSFDDYLSKYLRSTAPLAPVHQELITQGEGHEKRIAFIDECTRITHTPYANSFASRLSGLLQPPLSKTSPPYIRREYGLYPLGLQFLQEIAIVSRNKLDALSGKKSLVRAASPIDFLPFLKSM